MNDYLHENFNQITNEADAHRLTRICNGIIKKMIETERVLIIREDNRVEIG